MQIAGKLASFYDIISDNLDEFAASYELAAAGC